MVAFGSGSRRVQALYAYWAVAIATAVALVWMNAPSWLALAIGMAIAIASRRERPKQMRLFTTLALQLGVMALGAGMNLVVVLRVGLDGALITTTSLALAFVLGLALGRWLRVPGDTPLLVAVGT